MNSFIFLVSIMGNQGMFSKSMAKILVDFEFIYHTGYVIVASLALVVHEFFYSLLVSKQAQL